MNNKNRRNLFLAGGLYHIFRDQGFSGFVKPHSHMFYQLTIVESGRIAQMQNRETSSQLPGDLFFTLPGQEHSLFVSDGSTVYDTLSFAEEVFQKAAEAVPDAKRLIRTCPSFFTPDPAVHRLLRESCVLLLNWPEHRCPGVWTCGCHICTAAVILLLEAMRAAGASRSAPGDDPHCSPIRAIGRVLRYINQRYYEDLKIEDLVRMSGFSKSTFSVYFNRYVGITPKQYITEKRIHEALRLIRDTALPFNRIAEEVGYNDFSTFFRNFCRIAGQSPSDYRAMAQEDSQSG